MTRADFWCRVLGWLQLAAGVVVGAVILFLWELVKEIFMIVDIPAISFLVWVFVLIAALPEFLSGLFTVLFANAVEQSRNGLRGQSKAFLRVLMVFAGLWSAGVIGFAGLHVPALGILGILALMSVAIALMGPDWTADLFKKSDVPP